MTEQKIKMLKERYPAGTRVQLDRMGDRTLFLRAAKVRFHLWMTSALLW